MATYIRLTDYKDSDSKEQGFFKSENRYEAKQDDFEKIPGSPIAYWVSDRVKEIFEYSENLKTILNPKQGSSTGNDENYVRYWHEVYFNLLGLGIKNLELSQVSGFKYFPFNKGGETRKWYGNNEKILKFDNKSYSELLELGNHLPSRNLYFKKGLTWSKISNELNVRYDDYGFIFSSVGLKGFPKEENNLFILSFLNSNTALIFTTIISSTLSIVSGDIEKSGQQAVLHRLTDKHKMQAQVFVLPHHGSDSSFVPDVYEYTAPQLVLISNANDGNYLSSKAVLNFLRNKGIKYLSTAASGQITVEWGTADGEMRVSEER